MLDLSQKLKSLPMKPGVYIMRNSADEVIYVGKSKLLKNRVSQYFKNLKSHNQKTIAMVEHINDFDYILTDSEKEALILECNLIKKYRPKYNILLKDDKQYPYIKITMSEDYPRIFMTRRIVKDGSMYFGPYMSSFMVKETLEIIKKIFQVRSCNKRLPSEIGRSRPCLYYFMNQCSAPCNELISKNEYKEVFGEIENVLMGNTNKIIDKLHEKMINASVNLEYEKAAKYRDQITSLSIFGEKQKMTSISSNNCDVIGIYRDGDEICIQIFYFRNGKAMGSEYFTLIENGIENEEILNQFIKQFYFVATYIPSEIITQNIPSEKEELEEWLTEKSKHNICFTVPQKGKKKQMLNLTIKNAEESLKKHRLKRNKDQNEQNRILNELAGKLGLSKIPYRIECYDISNIAGSNSIGAEIVYKNAVPHKHDYRLYNIKSVIGANDYDSMKEVIYRRIIEAEEEKSSIDKKKLIPEKAKFLPLPDLILLDGGKGHVSVIRELLGAMNVNIPVYGLVKDDFHSTRALTDDISEFTLNTDSSLFKFLSLMQDEVHRFAISAYRKKHEDKLIISELEKINGVGPKTRKKLLEVFESVDNIKQASLEMLVSVVPKEIAKRVYNFYHYK